MLWPVHQDTYFGAWNKRCEKEVLEAVEKNPNALCNFDTLRALSCWNSAQVLAKLFEVRYQQLKSVNMDNPPSKRLLKIGNTALTLYKPRLSIWIDGYDGQGVELYIQAKGSIELTYYDIHPTASFDFYSNETYFGPHLLGEAVFLEDIPVEDGKLQADSYPVYIPFKDVQIDESFAPFAFN